MTSALLCVDLQNDFVSGSLAVEGGEAAAQKIAKYINADTAYDYIVATQDWHIDPEGHFSETPDYVDTWPVHCVAYTRGADLHSDLVWVKSKHDFDIARFYKGRFSAAYSGFEGHLGEQGRGPDLEKWLEKREVTHVDICGIATDYCVKATALDAVKLGFSATLLLPLTAAVTPEGGQAAIDEMKAAGVEIYGEL